jgi:uncharacterized protein (DUF1778 family)
MSDRPARSETFRMRLAPETLQSWREAAEAKGRTLTRFVEQSVDDVIATDRIIARNEARERQAAAEYHRLDPTEARRRDWGRTGEVGEGEEDS